MKVVVLYHPNSEFSRSVEEFCAEYSQRGHGEIEKLSLESQPGAALAKLYDVVAYPAVLVVRENGELLKDWQGTELPLMQEISSYANN